jgi:Rrf2 family protein
VRLEITRKADLAIRALVLLGESPERAKAAELAEALDTTLGFVPQVLAPLVKAGWVRSDPGPTGGYSCRVELDDVSVLQVIEAVDGATDAGRCVVADRACREQHPCVLHTAWGRARAELIGVLQATPLSAVGVGAEA